jgi:hypothetical protein
MSPTKVLAAAVVSVALAVPSVTAQNHRRNIYSTPEPIAPEALRRLNLVQGWRGFVPMDGRKDGFLRIVFDGADLFATTRSGMVTRIDAESGQVRWRARVGKPYTLLPYIAMNRRSVYLLANATMFSLDRETGVESWEYPLPGGISAGPAVDKTRVFVPTATTNLYAFALPYAQGATLSNESSEPFVSVLGETEQRKAPRPLWAAKTNIQLSFRPLISRRELLVLSPDGKGIGYHKTPRGEGADQLFAFDLDHRITVQPTSFADTAYIGCDDSTLYAINMRTGRLRWRHTAGTPITRSPVILDTDIFFASDLEGLARLDRITGEPRWKIPHGRLTYEGNPNADRFLAANERFVYATDDSGRLLVLDRKRGTQLSMLDTSAFRFPVVNDVTDRLYLAANDGLIVCLHDRDQREPLQLRKSLQDAIVQKQLDENISEPFSRDRTLQEVLANLEDSYDIDFVMDSRAFAEARLEAPQGKLVKPPIWENRPLRDFVKQVLAQVDATFVVEQDFLRVIPKPPRAKKDAGAAQPEEKVVPAKKKDTDDK